MALALGLLALLVYPVHQVRGDVRVIPGTVRVGLIQHAQEIGFSVSGTYQLIDQFSGQPVAEISPGQRWQVRVGPYGMELFRDGTWMGSFAGPLMVREKMLQVAVLSGKGDLLNRETGFVLGSGGKQVELNNIVGVSVLSAGGQKKLSPAGGLNLVTLSQGDNARRYRGNMEFRTDGKGLTAINQLPVEEYLYGVVPAEMHAYWPAEALKAQAVAARSYVLAQLGSYQSQGFDVLATQRSQVYRGYDGENPATTKAVDETRGVVMTYRGRPISAVFHSSSGGYTENSEDVWISRVDYLRARPDPADQNPQHYGWSKTYTLEELKQQFASRGYQFSEIYNLEEVERTSTGARVKCLAVTGLGPDGRPLTIEIGRNPAKSKADEVRMSLGLKSSLFTMRKNFDDKNNLVSVTFTGSGWGHGLGMSQYGALGLATQGYNYQDILKYYYTGITIASDYGN